MKYANRVPQGNEISIDENIASEYLLTIAILQTYKIDFDRALAKGEILTCEHLMYSFKTNPLITYFDLEVIKCIYEKMREELKNYGTGQNENTDKVGTETSDEKC